MARDRDGKKLQPETVTSRANQTKPVRFWGASPCTPLGTRALPRHTQTVHLAPLVRRFAGSDHEGDPLMGLQGTISKLNGDVSEKVAQGKGRRGSNFGAFPRGKNVLAATWRMRVELLS